MQTKGSSKNKDGIHKRLNFVAKRTHAECVQINGNTNENPRQEKLFEKIKGSFEVLIKKSPNGQETSLAC